MIQVGVLQERKFTMIFIIFILFSSLSARKTQKTNDDSKSSKHEKFKSEKDHHNSLDRGGYTGHSGSGCFLQ